MCLQFLADDVRLPITVGHLPPDTSKWNKIEHRLLAHISTRWRGKPLVDDDIIVNLIGTTSTTAGLAVTARLDLTEYPTGAEVTDAERAALALTRHAINPRWNYTLAPRTAPIG